MAYEAYANGWPDLKQLQELAEKVGNIPTFTSSDKEAIEDLISNAQALIEVAEDGAAGVPFDNTGTGVLSTNVQGAISELDSRVKDLTLLKTINIDSLTSGTDYVQFEYSGLSVDLGADLADYSEVIIVTEWFISDWTKRGNMVIIPTGLVELENLGCTAIVGNTESPNSNTLYVTMEDTEKCPYVWSRFNSSDLTPTKAKIFIYAR